MLNKIKFFMSSAFAFLLPFIKILLAQEGQLLMDSAMEAVRAASTMPGASGAQRRDAAFAIMSNKLTTNGVELATSAINSALEAAVLKLKES